MLPQIGIANTVQEPNKQIAALKSYLIQLRDELEAELSNVTYEMLSPALKKKIDAISEDIQRMDNFTNILAESVTANYVATEYLEANYITAEMIQATYVATDYLIANYLTASQISASYATFGYLSSNYASIGSLSAAEARIGAIESNYITANYVASNFASIGSLQSAEARIGTIEGNYASISYVNSHMISADAVIAQFLGAERNFSNRVIISNYLGLSGSFDFKNRNVTWGRINGVNCLVEAE